LVLFDDKVVVDASGNLLVVDDKDYEGLVDLSKKVAELPKAGNLSGVWTLEVAVTCQPIDDISVYIGGEVTARMSVYGYAPDRTKLSSPKGVIPASLKTLTGLVLEGWEGYDFDGERGPAIEKMRKLLKVSVY
jgi:hypothetical protein